MNPRPPKRQRIALRAAHFGEDVSLVGRRSFIGELLLMDCAIHRSTRMLLGRVHSGLEKYSFGTRRGNDYRLVAKFAEESKTNLGSYQS